MLCKVDRLEGCRHGQPLYPKLDEALIELLCDAVRIAERHARRTQHFLHPLRPLRIFRNERAQRQILSILLNHDCGVKAVIFEFSKGCYFNPWAAGFKPSREVGREPAAGVRILGGVCFAVKIVFVSLLSGEQRACVRNVGFQTEPLKHLMRCADGGGDNRQATLLFNHRDGRQ